MTIYGWKQFAEWSIKHSCLSEAEKTQAMQIHRRDWGEFCKWVVETYGEYALGLTDLR